MAEGHVPREYPLRAVEISRKSHFASFDDGPFWRRPSYQIMSGTVIKTTIIVIASSVICLVSTYHYLPRKVEHSQFVGQMPDLYSPYPSEGKVTRDSIYEQLQTLESLPPAFQAEPEKYYVFYDVSSKTVSRSTLNETLTSNPSHLLTLLLRRNMSIFATRLPQAWLTKFFISRKIPSLSYSFDPTYIRTLDFKTGDLVAGMYRVMLRSPTKIEFGIGIPPGSGIDLPPIDARLVFIIDTGDSKEHNKGAERDVTFKTQTLQYRPLELRDIVLPLERSVLRWLHNLASWWLLESGVSWLAGISEEEAREHEL